MFDVKGVAGVGGDRAIVIKAPDPKLDGREIPYMLVA
jgi:hypothetical protein